MLAVSTFSTRSSASSRNRPSEMGFWNWLGHTLGLEWNSELIGTGQLGTIKSMVSGGITRRASCWSRHGACRTQGCGHVVASPGHPHVKDDTGLRGENFPLIAELLGKNDKLRVIEAQFKPWSENQRHSRTTLKWSLDSCSCSEELVKNQEQNIITQVADFTLNSVVAI